ncbi:MAG: 23S rRNA pseudouridine(2604) synthase RluF [Algoriphagus sp.]|uniref:23S rRNA pseudouridine(2604) synthase RluF n=1 Tax=Algoriphagus sp. TaxID=1872435 RepID=UPI0026132F14|nr:23S rRNA pseudouridine(2604) synthase RluF [Algoriphagus sp.]MDG1275858.1 23S rRNA pseudouridine(2604) synthase RluF [Algoriphagus sp.]
MENESYIRINKYLSEVGFCSRREADKLLEQGRITLNGKIPELGTKVGPKDQVAVDGKNVGRPIQNHTYIAFNKPVGIVSTTDVKGEKDNIIDFIGHPQRIFPIGRLDKDSEGLIFLTSEGDIVNKILRAKNNHEKEYVVTVDRPVNDEFVRRMGAGIPILDTVTDPCKVERISKFKFRITLTQGLNRQIRRMCEYLGFKVVQLKRIRIMNIHLDLPVGKWRDLTEKELAELNSLISGSSKTFD